MSKLSVAHRFASKSSQKTIKTKDSLISRKSKFSGSFTSEHGSKFGRAVNRFPRPNDPGLVQTLSVENSRIIRTVFNPIISSESTRPDLTQIEATDCIRELGKSLNILDYEFNYACFWLLDVLSKHIKDLQMKSFSSDHQDIFLSWFRFVLRCISITTSSREEIFVLLQEMFKSAVEIIQEGKPIPRPEDIDLADSSNISPKMSADFKTAGSFVASTEISSFTRKERKRTLSQKSSRKSSKNSGRKSKNSVSRKSSLSGDFTNYEEVKNLNMQVYYTIIKIIYQTFADRFMFRMVSLVYGSPHAVTLRDVQVMFHDPKSLNPEPEPVLTAAELPKPRKKSGAKGKKKGKEKVKKKKSTSDEDDKGSKKGKPKAGKKQGKRDGSMPPASVIESEDKSDLEDPKPKGGKKMKKDAGESKKTGKGKKEKAIKKTSDKDDGGKMSGDLRESQNKAGKGDKSKRKGDKNRKKSDVRESKEGKEKVKSKKEKKGKPGAKSTKPKKNKKKSTVTSLPTSYLDKREVALRTLMKQFERPAYPKIGYETEGKETKNKFILPLSAAVDENYVENVINSILPPEVVKEAEPKVARKKSTKTSRKSEGSKKSIKKEKKTKSKSKKKK